MNASTPRSAAGSIRFGACLVAAAALAFSATACSEDECSTDSDCPSGRICRVGLCALDPGLQDTLVVPDGLDVTLECDPASSADLVLNEIMADPPSGVDFSGDGAGSSRDDEYVEIVNISSAPVGLLNVEIQVNDSKRVVGGFCLEPMSARVFTGAAGLPQLSNSGATVSLVVDGLVAQTHTYGAEAGDDRSVTLIDQLDPTGGWARHDMVTALPYSPGKCANGNDFPNCDGPGVVESDADASDGGGDGVVANCTQAPVAGDLVINELLADPTPDLDANGDGSVSDSGDEYVEIVNVSGATLLLAGVTVTEGGGKAFTFGPTTCLMAGQAAVVFGTAPTSGDFGGSLLFAFGTSFPLNNGGDSVTLTDSGATTLDAVAFGAEGGQDNALVRMVDLDIDASFVKHGQAPLSGGARMSPGRCQNGNAFPSCGGGNAEETGGDTIGGDTSTPTDTATTPTDTSTPTDTAGDVGPTCGPAAGAGDLVINELAGNPNAGGDAGIIDFNGDGTGDSEDDEFIEIVNVSGGPVQLMGVTINDAAATRYTFTVSVCLPAGNAVVVFGGGTPAAPPAGAIFIPGGGIPGPTGGISLNNGNETITLKSAGGATIDMTSYASATAGVSLTRSPDASGAFVRHDMASGAGSPNGSPGTCLGGGAFPGCLVQ